MEPFRAADLQVGGGHLYPTVVNYHRLPDPSLLDYTCRR
jgi:hypothetical protein